VADGKTARVTDNQMKRLQVLVEALCKKFSISRQDISVPSNWN
jgi:hypothetical protein